MQIQVNEIDKENHLQAHYLEFLEMTCRVIDEASFATPASEDEDEEESRRESRAFTSNFSG